MSNPISNEEVYKGFYESQRSNIKRFIKSLGKSELVNILQEMKIISKFKDEGYYKPLKGLSKLKSGGTNGI